MPADQTAFELGLDFHTPKTLRWWTSLKQHMLCEEISDTLHEKPSEGLSHDSATGKNNKK